MVECTLGLRPSRSSSQHRRAGLAYRTHCHSSTSASPLFQKEGPKRSEDYFIAQDEHATDTSDNCRNNMPGLNVHDLVRKFKDFTDKLFTLAPCIISNLYRLYY